MAFSPDEYVAASLQIYLGKPPEGAARAEGGGPVCRSDQGSLVGRKRGPQQAAEDPPTALPALHRRHQPVLGDPQHRCVAPLGAAMCASAVHVCHPAHAALVPCASCSRPVAHCSRPACSGHRVQQLIAAHLSPCLNRRTVSSHHLLHFMTCYCCSSATALVHVAGCNSLCAPRPNWRVLLSQCATKHCLATACASHISL